MCKTCEVCGEPANHLMRNRWWKMRLRDRWLCDRHVWDVAVGKSICQMKYEQLEKEKNDLSVCAICGEKATHCVRCGTIYLCDLHYGGWRGGLSFNDMVKIHNKELEGEDE